MNDSSFSLPEVVDLNSAKGISEGLLRHIGASAATVVNANALRRAGVPLLQILVAARRYSDAQGKPFAVEAPPDGALATMLSTYGLAPTLCGASVGLVPPDADIPGQRIDG